MDYRTEIARVGEVWSSPRSSLPSNHANIVRDARRPCAEPFMQNSHIRLLLRGVDLIALD